jgi:AraC-like DNA-binding protein
MNHPFTNETCFKSLAKPPRENESIIRDQGTQNDGGLEFPSRLSMIADWALLAKTAKYNCENLAGECLVSKRQLERFFLTKFKQPPKEWMQILRMVLARNLLEHGYTTKAVASELHYKGCCHFCREFRKYFGHNPQYYSPKPPCLISSMMSPFAHPSALRPFRNFK